MRQHKILTRSLLILSIVNFALAAPVAVRERSGVRLDANVTRNVTAASQKRWDPPSDEGEIPSPNLLGTHYSPPPSPDLQAIILELPKSDSAPPPATPDIPGSSTGPRLPMGSPQAGGSFSPAPGSWSPNVPESIHEPPQHLYSADLSQTVRKLLGPPPSGSPPSVELADLSQTVRKLLGPPPGLGSTGSSQKVPPNPTSSRLRVGSKPVAGSEGRLKRPSGFSPKPFPFKLPTEAELRLPQSLRPMPVPGSLPPPLPMPLPPPPRPMPAPGSLLPPLPPSHPGQPGPSRVPPPGFSVKPGTLSSTGNQPMPPQRPGVDPETHSQVNLDPQGDDLNEFWKNLMKDKIKPRRSDSNTVDLAEKDARSEYSILYDLPRFINKCYGL